MNITIDIDNETLSKAIEAGINGLDKDDIAELAKNSIISYLSERRNIEQLIFENATWGGPNYNSPRKWFVNIIEQSFTKYDLEPYRAKMLETINNNRREVIVDAIADAFSSLLVTEEFKDNIRNALCNIRSRNG